MANNAITDFRNAFHLEKMFFRELGGAYKLALGGKLTDEVFSVYEGFTNMPVFTGMTRKVDNIVGGDTYPYFYAIGGKYITRYYESGYGEFEDTFTSSTTFFTSGQDGVKYADILLSELGTLLFTNKRYLGFTISILCYGLMPNNATIVDSLGRNFVSLGVKVGDFVMHTQTGECFAISGISDGNFTNDKLTFASDFLSTSSNRFILFRDDQSTHDLNTNVGVSHFSGQIPQENWSRQIIDFSGEYYILNGNYVASLDNTETVFDPDTLQLLPFMQGNCASVNNNLMLFGGSKNGKGALCLWTGEDAYFVAVQYVPQEVLSIQPYKGGWIYFAGSAIYFTDGYTSKEIDRLPDTDGMDQVYVAPNGMNIVGENIVMQVSVISGYTRKKSGVYWYDLKVGKWIYFQDRQPFHTWTTTVSPGAVYFDSTNKKFLLSANLDNGDGNYYPTLQSIDVNSKDEGMAILYLEAPGKTTNSLEVVIARDERTAPYADITARITIAVADAQKVLWNYDTVKTYISGTSMTLDHSRASVGDIIRVLSGISVRRIAFITAITESDGFQTITLDRSIGTAYEAGNIIQIMPFKMVLDKQVNTSDIQNPLLCNIGEGVGFYILVHIDSASGLELRSMLIK